MNSPHHIFKAGIWHGISLLEKKLLELGIADEARLAHICNALVAEWEAAPCDIKEGAFLDGLFAVNALTGKSLLPKEAVQ